MKIKFILIIIIISVSKISFCQISIDAIHKEVPKLLLTYNLYNGYQEQGAYTTKFSVNVYIGNFYILDVLHLQNGSNKQMDDSIVNSKLNENIKMQLIESIQNDPKYINSTHPMLIRMLNNSEYYEYKYYNDKYFFVADSVNFNWQLVQEYKYVDKYKCQKAIGEYKGSKVEAWFTEEIPVNCGPWYISGLPGVVVEYKNSSNGTYYKLNKIETNALKSNIFKNISSAKIITREEAEKYNERDKENVNKILKKISEGNENN